MMTENELIVDKNKLIVPPCLAKLGISRETSKPDIYTVQRWYPQVIENYKYLCNAVGVEEFGGGTFNNQGYNLGYIISGYRNIVLEGRYSSPHFWALALDFFADLIYKKRLEMFKRAAKFFNRVGLYRNKNTLHVDMVNEAWLQKYTETQSHYWVVDKNNNYHMFNDLERAYNYGKEIA